MTKQYNRQVIRQLVEAVSNADGIENLAFDLFEEVYGQFSAEMTRSRRVRDIIDYAIKNDRVSDLLNYIEQNYPRQYIKFARKLEIHKSKASISFPSKIEEHLISIEELLKTNNTTDQLLTELLNTQTMQLLKENTQTEQNLTSLVTNSLDIQRKQIVEEIGSILLNERDQFEKDAQTKRAEIAFDFSAKRYGIGYDILEIECIIDNDGSAIINRTSTILAFSTINSLDTYLLVPESASTNKEREVGFLKVKSLSEDRDVIVNKRKKEYQKSSIELSFSPPLKYGNECRFQMVEKIPPGIFAINLSEEELDLRETEYDYFAWNINRPTRHLRMQVFIPESNTPDIYSSEVRYASASGLPDERSQIEEEKRVQNPSRVNQAGRCILTLGVNHPMIGLIYLVRWLPKRINK